MPKTSRPAARTKSKKPAPKHLSPATQQIVALPRTLALVRSAARLLGKNRGLFGRGFLLAWAAVMVAAGLAQQAEYADLSAATREAVSVIPGSAAQVAMSIGILLSSVLAGTTAASLSDMQQFYRFSLFVLAWLVTVWLVRHVHTGKSVSVRDGLYNAGAPLISTLLVLGFGILQLVPLALLVSVFATVLATGAGNAALITVTMLFASLLLSALTLYWLSSTALALMVVTIPGTYPLAALRTARTISAGVRLSILLRIAAGLVVALLAAIAGLLPFILLDAVFAIELSFVIIAVLEALAVLGVMFMATYLYLLYRSIIDARTD